MGRTLGVGFLGAGPVTQAIHLPVLATMPDRFRVESVMDIDADVAANVAARCGAKSTTSVEATIEDKAVDIIAICSPNAFHADQIVAACEAGKRAILCEKPLAVSPSEVDRIRHALERSGTPLLVGTMHAYDPAYRAVLNAWQNAGDAASFIQSSIYLPSNDRFIDQATDQRNAPTNGRGPGGNGPEFEATMFQAAMLGLAIHNIPLIRDYYPSPGRVMSAEFIRPFGYSVLLSNGLRNAQLSALMPGAWPPKWRFRVIGPAAQIEIDFPPSYVLSGSAKASITMNGATRVFSYSESGYERQWQHLHDVVDASRDPDIPLATALEDIAFALELASAGSQSIRSAA